MKFNTVQKNGYFLNFQEDTMPDCLAIHQFCGKHTISGAYCPNCEKPLLRFISFNLSDNKIKVGIRHSILHLLFCWTCNVAQDPFFYKIIGENEIEILEYEKGGVELDFPYENYPLYFPYRNAWLEQISDKEKVIISKINLGQESFEETKRINPKLFKPQHQIGGEPILPQCELDNLKCPSCNSSMPFLATIGNECDHPEGFCGNDYVAVVYYLCGSCSVVGVLQQVD